MIEKAREAVEAMKEAFDIFFKMELPIDERNCLLGHEAVTAIINGFQQLERERDAAVERLARYKKCIDCRRYPEIKKNLFCDDCVQGDKWQWCGEPLEVENENTKENTGGD